MTVKGVVVFPVHSIKHTLSAKHSDLLFVLKVPRTVGVLVTPSLVTGHSVLASGQSAGTVLAFRRYTKTFQFNFV